MVEKVQKRDGTIVDYDLSKISLAIGKAGNSTKEFDKKTTNSLTKKVDSVILSLEKEMINVEEIQDIVEAVLLTSKYKQTAKAYILYRDQHDKLRDLAKVVDTDLIDKYLEKSDWQVNENSNMTYSLQGLNNYISSEITKLYWLNKIYPSDIKNYHNNGDYHLHDLNTFAVYCVGWDLHDLLVKGFGGVSGKLDSAPAKHFRTALGQIVNFIYTLQGECYSDDTEVLTNFGWKFFKDLNGDEEFLTLHMDSNLTQYQKATKFFEYWKDEELINFTNGNLDLFVTKNHNLLVIDKSNREHLILIKAQDFDKNKHSFIDKDPSIEINNIPYTGHVYCVEVPNHTLYVRRNGKATWCGNCAGAQAFSNVDTLLAPFIRYDALTYDQVKQAIQEFIFNLNVPTRTGFQCLSEDTEIFTPSGWVKYNDLEKGSTIITFNLISKTYQPLPAHNIFIRKYKGKMYNIKNNYTDQLISPKHNVVRLNDKNNYELESIEDVINLDMDLIVPILTDVDSPEYIYDINIKKNEIYESEYDGIIWCPTTTNGTVIARRNGKIFITGNCPFSNVTMDLKVPEHFKNNPIVIGGEYKGETYSEFQTEMDVFNQAFTDVMTEGDHLGRVFTFPIPTYNITKDFEWDNSNLDGVWKMTAKYGIPYFSNFINSDMSPDDSRSMCPLSGDTRIMYLSTRYKGVEISPIKSLYYNQDKETYSIYSCGKFIPAKINKYDDQKMIKVTLCNGHSITMSDNHLNFIKDKIDSEMTEIEGKNLTTDMYIPFSTIAYDGIGGTYDLGFLLGCYAGDGSMDDYRVVFSLSEGKKENVLETLKKYITENFGDVCTVSQYEDEKLISLNVYSDAIIGICNQFIEGKGTNKKYSRKIFTMSKEFRRGVLDGHYATDGGNRHRIYTSSEEMVKSITLLAATLGTVTNITEDNRDGRLSDNLVYTVREYKFKSNKYHDKNNTLIYFTDEDNKKVWFKIKSIEPHRKSTAYCIAVDDGYKPEFTIADNGIVTHNCRLRLNIKDINSTLEKRGGGLFGSNPLTGCYSSDTEVLTNEGWKLFTELNHNETVLTHDKDTGIASWDKPTEYFEYDYDGNMIHFNKSDELDLLVTPDHRMLINDKSGAKIIKRAKDVVETDGIPNRYKTFTLENSDIQYVAYSGKVYCLKVKNGIFYVRRNGKTCWSGNSVGVVTINLPRLGFLSNTKEEFIDRLLALIDSASESLEIKRKILEVYTEKNLYPYTKRYLADIKTRYEKYWQNHFSTIGIIGMNEACLNLFGEDIVSENGMKFSLEICDIIRNRLVEIQNKTGNNYNFEATPAEGTTYRLALMDKKKYSGIMCANEEDYLNGEEPFYTNSTQLPVNHTDDIFEVFDLQDELQQKYTGGTVIHAYIGEQIVDHLTVKKLVKVLCETYHTPYFTITPTFSICLSHGYLSGKQEICPICNKPTEIYSRVTGYIRPVSQWNKGKCAEFEKRKMIKAPDEVK